MENAYECMEGLMIKVLGLPRSSSIHTSMTSTTTTPTNLFENIPDPAPTRLQTPPDRGFNQ